MALAVTAATSAVHANVTAAIVAPKHFAGTRCRVHTPSGPGPDGTAEHIFTSMRSEVQTHDHRLCRADPHRPCGLIARALTLFITRMFNALGVRHGNARTVIGYVPDRGTALLSIRANPSAGDVLGHALQAGVPDEPVRDTAQLITTGQRHTVAAPRRTQVATLALLPRRVGAPSETLLRVVATLPPVGATTHLESGTRVHVGRIAGRFLLAVGDRGAIGHDHQAVRAAEKHDLYGRSA
ncbi:hypothetical protein [Streptomyces sp. NPDC002221]|uniref:hypothetical protein n=1 Tax=Streptomyces sp. NPDC002221 TaxID=3364639 RepID=UPI00369FFF39